MTAEERRRREERDARCALAKCPLAGKGDARCEKCTGPVAWTDERGRRTGVGDRTHRQCTSCPMNGLGLPVCWAACDGPTTEYQTDGQRMVTLGGMEDPCRFVGSQEAYDARLARLTTADSRADLPPETAEALLRIVRMIAGLSRTEVLYLHARLQGNGGAEASKSLGFTKQRGHQVGKRAAQKYPELAAFFSAMGRAQRRGSQGATPGGE